MVNLETAYARLPVALQNAACVLEGGRIQYGRFSRGYRQMAVKVEARGAMSIAESEVLRDERLRGYIEHAATTVPYYERLFRKLGIAPTEIRTLGDLAALPVLTKQDVVRSPEDFVSRSVRGQRQKHVHTSGTTGAGFRFVTTIESVREQWAVWWRYWHRHGIREGTLCGYFVGRSIVPIDQSAPPFWRYNLPQRRILFSAYHMSRRNLDAYVAELRRRRPPWLHGYPSSLVLVAEHLLESGADLGYEVKWLTTAAENLMPHQADALQRAFGLRPRQHYGMAEAVANISECEQGSLHVDEDFAAVEFVPDQVGDGSTAVIGTNMSNLAMPLLRFSIEDLVRLPESGGRACVCARSGRLVEDIDGRREDYIVLRNGARVGRLDHAFKDMTWIREAQIRQKEPGAIFVLVAPSSEPRAVDGEALLRELRARIGEDTRIDLEFVDEIERGRSGKLRFVVSEVSR